jgi:hypothetical protein
VAVGVGDAVGDSVGDGIGEGVDDDGATVGVAVTVGEGDGVTITMGAHAPATRSAMTNSRTELP